jgi:hypothetical protein
MVAIQPKEPKNSRRLMVAPENPTAAVCALPSKSERCRGLSGRKSLGSRLLLWVINESDGPEVRLPHP